MNEASQVAAGEARVDRLLLSNGRRLYGERGCLNCGDDLGNDLFGSTIDRDSHGTTSLWRGDASNVEGGTKVNVGRSEEQHV